MDSATFIYRNRSDAGFYDASTREIRGGPDKVIVYINGVLFARWIARQRSSYPFRGGN
jgi:hypothetical protein